MAKLKYINFEHIGLVIFETTVGHDTMRQLVGHTATSAGFCQFPYDPDDPDRSPVCFGESVSLKLKATDEDTKTLQRCLNPYGW
jgi:hypothetical protein